MRLQMITAMALTLNSTREAVEPVPENTFYHDMGARGPLSPLMLKDRDVVIIPEARADSQGTADAEGEVLLPLEAALEKAAGLSGLSSMNARPHSDEEESEEDEEPQ